MSEPLVAKLPKNLAELPKTQVERLKALETIRKTFVDAAAALKNSSKKDWKQTLRPNFNTDLKSAYHILGLNPSSGYLIGESGLDGPWRAFLEYLKMASGDEVKVNDLVNFTERYDKAIEDETKKKEADMEEKHKRELDEKDEEKRRELAAANADKLEKVAAVKHKYASPEPSPEPAPAPPAEEKKKSIDVEKFLQGQRALAMLSHLSMDQLQRFSPETQLAVLNYKWLKSQSRGKKNWPTPVKKAPPPRETNELTKGSAPLSISKRTQRELKK